MPVGVNSVRIATTLVAVAILLLLSPLWPVPLLSKADAVGYAICHQLPERSFHLAGRQLPLCARCTGTFLGVLWGLMLLARKGRASRLPPVRVLVVLVAFILANGVDGLNSYLTYFPGAPHLYQPHNLLRLTMGALHGVALSILIFPVFNFVLWKEPGPQEVVGGFGELSVFLGGVLLIVGLVGAQFGFLLYPVAILSVLGVLGVLTLVNGLFIVLASGREGKAENGGEALWTLACGLGATIMEIAVIGLVRAQITRALGLPF